jgi:Phosphate transporter family
LPWLRVTLSGKTAFTRHEALSDKVNKNRIQDEIILIVVEKARCGVLPVPALEARVSMRNDIVLVLVVFTALAFDFTNGFHDTGNAMATSIATRALRPRVAVALSGVLNVAGAFLSLAVAATIANGLVDTKAVTLTVVAAGLAGGIIWNLLTWLFGIPSSSSHALIGGVIGATMAAAGGSAVQWHGLTSKVIIPAALSPVIAALVAAMLAVHRRSWLAPSGERCVRTSGRAGVPTAGCRPAR